MFLNIFFGFVIFIFGLVVGSFLNCVIYRLYPHTITDTSTEGSKKESIHPFGVGVKTSESFLRGRSFCPECKKTLNWRDLIPLFSFLLLKGKCRYCQKPISWQYPLVELATGILFVFAAQLAVSSEQLTVFNFLNLCYLLTVTCFLIVIFVYDLKHYIILDKVIYPAIAIVFIYNIYQLAINNFTPTPNFGVGASQLAINNFLSAFGAAAFFLAIVLISRGKWMGIGDIKLAFFMGLFLSFPKILVALFSAFFIGAIIGLGLITFGKKTLKSEVPFGPFLVTGTFLAMFFGERLIDWYLRLFLL